MTWFTLSVTVLLEAINLTLILTQDYKLLLFFLFAITRNYWRQLGSLQLTRIWTILSFRQWWNGTRPGWGLCSFSYTHYFVLILLFYLNKKTLKMRISCWPCNNQLRRMGCLNFFWHPQWLDILVFLDEGATQMLVLQLFHWFYCNVKEPTSAPRLIKTRDYRPQWCCEVCIYVCVLLYMSAFKLPYSIK